MPIIIDGWNLIRSPGSDISDVDTDSLESARLLILYLEQFQKTHRDPMVVVFDSTREYLGIEYPPISNLKVVASKNADDYIKRYIDRVPERQRRNVRVVSSDSEVYFHAKGAYATPIKSEIFWDKLTGKSKKRYV